MRPRTGLAFVLALAALPAIGGELTPFDVPFTSQGFEQINADRGVTVFKDHESPNVRLAAEGVVPASPEVVRDALLAYELQPELFGNVAEARILVRGEDRLLPYQRLDLPVVDDRDNTLWITWGRDGDTLWIRHRLAPSLGPAARDDAVRVPFHAGSWQIRPLGGGRRALVRLQVTIDLGGWIPRWLARAAAGDEVPGVFADICRVAARLGRPCAAPTLVQEGAARMKKAL